MSNLFKRAEGSHADIDLHQDQDVAMILGSTGTHYIRKKQAANSPDNSQRGGEAAAAVSAAVVDRPMPTTSAAHGLHTHKVEVHAKKG